MIIHRGVYFIVVIVVLLMAVFFSACRPAEEEQLVTQARATKDADLAILAGLFVGQQQCLFHLMPTEEARHEEYVECVNVMLQVQELDIGKKRTAEEWCR